MDGTNTNRSRCPIEFDSAFARRLWIARRQLASGDTVDASYSTAVIARLDHLEELVAYRDSEGLVRRLLAWRLM
jgi:hypothetical protein